MHAESRRRLLAPGEQRVPEHRQLGRENARGGVVADEGDRTGVQRKAIVISACYSGIFIPRLADSNTLVITAADANHPSFGCEDKARWTYFGDAFFNAALRHAASLEQAFLDARALVRKRELREAGWPIRA